MAKSNLLQKKKQLNLRQVYLQNRLGGTGQRVKSQKIQMALVG
jgi:hypothetical protein